MSNYQTLSGKSAASILSTLSIDSALAGEPKTDSAPAVIRGHRINGSEILSSPVRPMAGSIVATLGNSTVAAE
jgi:hypothetical protein